MWPYKSSIGTGPQSDVPHQFHGTLTVPLQSELRVYSGTLTASPEPLKGGVQGSTPLASFPFVSNPRWNALHVLAPVYCNKEHYTPSICYSTPYMFEDLSSSIVKSHARVRLSIQLAKLVQLRMYYLNHDFVVLRDKSYNNFVFDSVLSLKPNCQPMTAYMVNDSFERQTCLGGAKVPQYCNSSESSNVSTRVWTYGDIRSYIVFGSAEPDTNFRFARYIPRSMIPSGDVVAVDLPVQDFVNKMSKPALLDFALKHSITQVTSKQTKRTILQHIQNHVCTACPDFLSIFTKVALPKSGTSRSKKSRAKKFTNSTIRAPVNFPPSALSLPLTDSIVRGFSEEVQLQNHLESACTVCELLAHKSDLHTQGCLRWTLTQL